VTDALGQVLDDTARQIRDSRATITEGRLLQGAVEAQDQAVKQVSGRLEQMRRRLPKAAALTDGDETFRQIERFSERRALADTIPFLRADAAVGAISIPEFLALTRDLSMGYFSRFVVPILKADFIVD
jgi:hypothetical protein